MRLLRFISLLFLASTLTPLCFWAQTSQPSTVPKEPAAQIPLLQNQETPGATRAPSSQSTPQPTKVLPPVSSPPVSSPQGAPPLKFKIILVPPKKLHSVPNQLPDEPLDPEIHLRKNARVPTWPDRL
jgi:hypothetical protein